MSNIKSVTPIGKHQTYDLEIDHPDHQFYLANGVLTSNSHATAYAIDSFYCAWLLKHHETEWLTAYLESSGTDDKKAEAFSIIKGMGYQIIPIDVNLAGLGWTALPNKRFMPSLMSCKGIGASAVDDLMYLRPFETIEDMLWDKEGHWKLGKFNKKALEALIKLKAFDSLDCVGEGKLFSSYHLMHTVIIEHMGELKKSTKKDNFVGQKNFYDLIRDLGPTTEEWTRQETAGFMLEILGSVDVMQLVPSQVFQSLDDKGVSAIEDATEVKDLHWFIVSKCAIKKSKSGKQFLDAEVMGVSGKSVKLKVWAWNSPTKPEPLSMWVAEIDKNEQWGCATMKFKMREITF